MVIRSSIKTRFIAILLVTEILVIATFITAIVMIFNNNLRENSLRVVSNIQGFYSSLIDNDIKMLSAAVDTFITNDAFKPSMMKSDKEALLKQGEDLFFHNRDRYGITHFYYINNEGVCLLRMHQPSLSGDTITRTTFEESRKTRRIASGIELGKTAYALRVVKPYMYNGQQIGFVEFGEEIDHFDKIIKSETGIDVIVLVDKQFLSRDKYKATQSETGKPDKWDELNGYVIFGNTFGKQSYFANTVFNPEEVKDVSKAAYLGTVSYDERTLIKGAFPFYSFGNKQTGLVYILSDATEEFNAFYRLLYTVAAAGIVTLMLSFLIALYYLQTSIVRPIVDLANRANDISLGKHLDQEIQTTRTDEIGLLTHAFERMRISLSKVMQMLAGGDKAA